MMWRGVMFSSALALATGCAWFSNGEGSGPWKAQIVDAETGQPLEGVVVLASWIKCEASMGGWAAGKYYDSAAPARRPDRPAALPIGPALPWCVHTLWARCRRRLLGLEPVALRKL